LSGTKIPREVLHEHARNVRVRTLALLLLCFSFAVSAAGWGPEVHQRIADRAIESLRDPIKEYFEENAETLYELLEDPARDRSPARFFLDRYGVFPFEDIPPNREFALRRFSEEQIEEYGDGVWRLGEAYEALVEAFRSGDFDLVLELASDIAFVAADLGMPLHTSSEGDGGATGQDGLTRRFDTELTSIFSNDLRVRDSASVYIDRPGEFIESLPLKTYVWVDNIVFTDTVARLGVSNYDRFYMDGMWRELGPLVERLTSDSARDIASLWYTAWVTAGRPDVPES